MYKVIPTTTYTVRDSITYRSLDGNYKTETEAQLVSNVANEVAEETERATAAKLRKEFAALQTKVE
jgi:hypothetical protein